MEFKNLKIRFDLKSELIADRFMSIDSILLSAHYGLQRKKGLTSDSVFVETKDDLENLSKWIEVKNGAISGSIWYIEPDAFLNLWNIPVRKTTDAQAMLEATGKSITSASKPTPSSGEFKRFDLAFETMNLKSVYFYVRGDLEYITELCKRVKYLGKKSSIGYGWVSGFEITSVEEDKSFMIDEFTPSKPLSCALNKIDSKKVTFYRTLPPYYDKRDQEACYMPTSSLVERSDNSRNGNFEAVILQDYLSNTQFLHEKMSSSTKFDFEKYPVAKGLTKIGTKSLDGLLSGLEQEDTEDVEVVCACCGRKTKRAVVGDIKKVFSANFNDFPTVGAGDAICEECLWSVQSESCSMIDFSFVNKESIDYLYGAKMTIKDSKLQTQYRKDFIENLGLIKPLYSVNFNTNSGKSNHIAFKGNVSISNALAVFNYGDTGAEYVDVELLNEALAEMIRLMEATKVSKKKDSGLKKTHFLNIEGYKENASISQDIDSFETRVLLSEFYKKYNASIRRALHKVVI